MRKFFGALLATTLISIFGYAQNPAPSPSSTPVIEAAATPAPTPAPTPVVGHDSNWRFLLNLGLGTIGLHGDKTNTVSQDYEDPKSAAFGVLVNYRSDDAFGLEFGTKVFGFSHKAKNSNLELSLAYLALPLELRYKLAKIGQRSSFFVKGGVTYLILLSARVDDPKTKKSGDDWDWDDWDLYPTPPTKGSYRSSFKKSDWLFSIGGGFDFLLFQVHDSFNMSLIPELMYYRSFKAVGKSSEFGSDLYNEGAMVNLSIAFGF